MRCILINIWSPCGAVRVTWRGGEESWRRGVKVVQAVNLMLVRWRGSMSWFDAL